MNTQGRWRELVRARAGRVGAGAGMHVQGRWVRELVYESLPRTPGKRAGGRPGCSSVDMRSPWELSLAPGAR